MYILERELKPVSDERRQELLEAGFVEREETETEVIFERYFPPYVRLPADPITLAQLQRDCHLNSVNHDFWKNSPNIPEKLCLIHSEVSEALEEYRNGRELGEVWYSIDKYGKEKPEGFCMELADIMIRCMDLADFAGVDLWHAIQLKHAYNKTRPIMHGGKLC
jgi:hypothetical protein